MDFVPFTWFFMACLFNLQANVVGKPQSWPAKCSGQYYCQELIKPPGYPSDERLVQIYKDNKKRIDLLRFNETGHRDSEGTHLCRQYQYMLSNVTMIIDEKKEIRYTLYIPGMFEIEREVIDCQKTANETLEQMYIDQGVVCIQATQKYPYIVLTHDMENVETVNIMELNSSCPSIHTQNKMTTVKYYK